MLSFLQIIRLIGVLLIVAFALLYIFKNYENIALLLAGFVLVILSSFLISYINYTKFIEPFFKNAGFIKLKKSPKIEHINYDDLYLDYAFLRDDLSLAKLRLERIKEFNDKQKSEQIFSGLVFIKNDVKKQDFSVLSAPIFNKTSYKLCKLDNVDFNKYFHLYCADTIQIYRLFSPKKLDKISTIAKNLNKKISVIYDNNSMYLYLHNFRFSKNIKEEFNQINELISEFQLD